MGEHILITVIILLIASWNLLIAVLGLFPQFLSTATGTLTKVNTKRNVPTRHGPPIPILTRYRYTYKVNGKEYRYTGEVFHSKRCLFPKASMVYVKWFPRHAYPNKFKGTTEWCIGLSMLFIGLLLVWIITSV